jgi:hypothetical protein
MSYQVIVKTPTGIPIKVLTQFVSLKGGRFDRSYQALEIVIPQSEELPVGTFYDDMILELWRSQDGSMVLDGETAYLLRKVNYKREGKQDVIYLRAYDLIYLLDGREVEYAAGSSQAVKSDVACDFIKEVIRENFTTATDTTRRISSSYFTVAADDGFGATITKAFSRQYVYPLLQNLCEQSRDAGTWVTFDVVYGGTLPAQFRTFVGQRGNDLRTSLLISDKAGNLANPSIDWDYTDERNAAYMAGKGEGADRAIGSAVGDRATRSPWSRREVISENFQTETTALLDNEARALLEKYKPRVLFTGEIVQTEGTRYGVNWNYGDYVRAQYLGFAFDCRVIGYNIEYSNSGGTITDKVTAYLRSDT